MTALKVSLTRSQYEQLLDTWQWLTSSFVVDNSPNTFGKHGISRVPNLADINEEDLGVSTLNMDPQVRAKLFPVVSAKEKASSKQAVGLKGS